MRPLTHSHDTDDQLTGIAETDAAATPTGSFAYGYDLAGNRTTADRTTPAAGTVNRQWTPNGLNQLTAQSAGPEAGAYTHDLDGNLLADNTRTYQWDAENRLVGVTGPFGTVTWEYDAFSRRVKQHDTAPAGPEMVRDLIWEGLSIIENRNQATGEIRRYYGNGEERQLAAAVTRLHYTTDHLGSIRELTDATGTIRARYDYDPYGNVTKLSGNLDTDFAYTGHYYHAASGLHLAPYRGYDPKLGRWLSRDPIGEEGGINLYGYVGNQPTTMFDPLGLWQFSANFGWGPVSFYISFGHNHGQNNITGRVGFGKGWSVSYDKSEGPVRCPGLHGNVGATGSLGDLVGGAGGSVEYDGSIGRHGGVNYSAYGRFLIWTMGLSGTETLGAPEFEGPYKTPLNLSSPERLLKLRFQTDSSCHIGIGGTYVWP